MVFEIKNKVALITGGASGLGFKYAEELLKNGAKGVTLADIIPDKGAHAVSDIEEKFGTNKALFVETDVTNTKQFEDAFLKTIEKYGHVDILINNAGILNEAIWEKEILININGTVIGTTLAIDQYLAKYKKGDEALIVNISSIGGTHGYGFAPIYCATKFAVAGTVKSWGIPQFYEETKVRVIGICPGVTLTTLVNELDSRVLGDKYQRCFKASFDELTVQEPDFVATEAVKVMKFAPNGTLWIIEGGEPAYQYIVPHRITMKNNVLPKE